MIFNQPSLRRETDDSGLAKDYVRELQRDGRLLLRYVARHVDRPLVQPGVGSWRGAAEYPQPVAHILTSSPEAVSASGAQMEQLAVLVDNLAQRAAPASVTSIRLTAAYLRVPVEGLEPPKEVQKRAKRLKKLMLLIVAIAVLATLISVLLLAHVDSGQRSMRQLQAVRADLAETAERMSDLPNEAWMAPPDDVRRTVSARPQGEAYRGFCHPPSGEGPPARNSSDNRMTSRDQTNHLAARRLPAGTEEGERAQALCSKHVQSLLREELVFRQLEGWNQRTERLYGMVRWIVGAPINFVRFTCRQAGLEFCSGMASHAIATQGELWHTSMWYGRSLGEHWRRTELRTSSSISLLTGFVLPLLLGCVGGCAYALRRLDQRLSNWTLEFRDGSHSLLRVLLATMLGGLVGIVWTGDAPVQLGGFTLTLAAVAFFVGFSLEVVFSVIETMVEAVAGKLRAQPPAPIVLPMPSANGQPIPVNNRPSTSTEPQNLVRTGDAASDQEEQRPPGPPKPAPSP